MILDTLQLQKDQYRHDKRNHADILCLHKNDRVKHYALHFGKYSARFDGIYSINKTRKQNSVDSVLVSLSSANTLLVTLGDDPLDISEATVLLTYKEATAMYCDGAEKIDHGENFWQLLRDANRRLFYSSWFFLCQMSNCPFDELEQRRIALGKRHFYIEG